MAMTIEAKISGDALVLSLDDKDHPLVWRADMDRLSLAAFEIGTRDALTVLSLKTPQGTEDIHAFGSRADAVAALRAVTHALLQAPARVQHIPGYAHHGGGFFRGVMKLLFALVIGFALIAFLTVVIKPGGGDAPLTSSVKTGVPMPVDDIIGR